MDGKCAGAIVFDHYSRGYGEYPEMIEINYNMAFPFESIKTR
jgi:hypothetical protein